MNPAQLFVKIRSALLASWRLAFFMSFPAAASAQASQPAYVPASSAVSAGSMLQMLTGLLLVLAVIGAAAWLLKRFAAKLGQSAAIVMLARILFMAGCARLRLAAG